jgi:hypothetical protein
MGSAPTGEAGQQGTRSSIQCGSNAERGPATFSLRALLCSGLRRAEQRPDLPLLGGSWSDANDTTPLEQICARVDHVNSLEEDFPEQRDEEVRHQLEALENQCQSALSDRAEED